MIKKKKSGAKSRMIVLSIVVELVDPGVACVNDVFVRSSVESDNVVEDKSSDESDSVVKVELSDSSSFDSAVVDDFDSIESDGTATVVVKSPGDGTFIKRLRIKESKKQNS